jgi:hypothetical protein
MRQGRTFYFQRSSKPRGDLQPDQPREIASPVTSRRSFQPLQATKAVRQRFVNMALLAKQGSCLLALLGWTSSLFGSLLERGMASTKGIDNFSGHTLPAVPADARELRSLTRLALAARLRSRYAIPNAR